MRSTKFDAIFVISLLAAIGFALIASIWVYYVNLVVALPLGAFSFLLLRKGKKEDPHKARYKIITIILIAGIVISLVTLLFLLIGN